MKLAIILVIGAALLAAALWKWKHRETRRRQAALRPFPDAWDRILRKRMPIFRGFPPALQERLRELIQVFLDEKKFEGCKGFRVNDEVRVTIAAFACLLTVNNPALQYARLRSILVYPASFRRKGRSRHGAFEREGEEVLSGESWENGTLVLAWRDILDSCRDAHDGYHVVLHECAHQLCPADGDGFGLPPGLPAARQREWTETLRKEYERLRKNSNRRRRTVIDPYGAEEEPEFFATATEAFFEKPRAFARWHPDLYRVFKDFFGIDPRGW